MTSRLDWFQGSFGIDYSAICEGRGSSGTFKQRFDAENGPECRKNNPGSYQRYMMLPKPEKPTDHIDTLIFLLFCRTIIFSQPPVRLY